MQVLPKPNTNQFIAPHLYKNFPKYSLQFSIKYTLALTFSYTYNICLITLLVTR